MNEQIKALMGQTLDEKFSGTWSTMDMQDLQKFAERFAELIVRECLEQGSILAKHYIDTHPEQEQVMLLASIADYSSEIKKHFGVEE